MKKSIKKKILYFMHVDWNWIKQRPHFLVEGLAEYGYDVDVFYPFAKNRKILTTNSTEKERINLIPYYRAPYKVRNNKFLRVFSNFSTRLQFPKKNYDIIVLTYPEQIEFIPSGFNGSIIYDCMDDHSAFDGVNSEQLISLEKDIIMRSTTVLVSSNNLRNKVSKYTCCNEDKFILVRNGLGSHLKLDQVHDKKQFNKKIVYLGTISEWVDFDLLIKALDKLEKDVTIDFIGPVTVDIPEHPKMNFLGPIDSKDIAKALEPYGTFIMPFVVNELIRSVDPVKFYEYIHLGGNIVTCRYDEIERFADFVNFYSDENDLAEILGRDTGTSVRSADIRKEFLSRNTWNHRVKQLVTVLESIDG